MQTAIIVRYCEIHLKGKNRGYFEKLLRENIKRSLAEFNVNLTCMHRRYVIDGYNDFDLPLIKEKLKKIAGIHTFSVAYVVPNDFEEIKKVAVPLLQDKSGSFKIETNRADKRFPFNSMEVSREIGGCVLDKYEDKLHVDVKNPENIVFIDIREDGKTFIYTDIIHCMSGMPVGSAGKGLLLLSGGIDSPVAGYMMMKRGMKINALHFHSYPYTGEAAKEKVVDLAKILAEYNGGVNLYVASFTHIQEEIHKKCPEEFMITLMRRFMMRIAERLCRNLGDQAIITGESLGQVASQTIESITSSNSVVTIPVLRPLIGFDKNEIIDISKKIDSYDTSILPYEDCCTVFLPKFPAIKPNLEKVVKAENNLDVEKLIDEVFEKLEKISI